MDQLTGSFSPYPQRAVGDTSKLLLKEIYTIFEDKKGTLWVGTDSEGLCRIDKKTGSFKSWVNIPEDNKSISDDDVFTIFEYSKNILLLGTYGGGLNVFNKQTEEFFSYQNDENDSTSISNNVVLASCEENKYLWLATYRLGLNRIALDKGGDNLQNVKQFTKYLHDKNNLKSISSNTIRSLFTDKAGVVWVGTLGEGVNKYDRKKIKFKHYKSKLSSYIYGISESEKYLWVGTSEGLERYNKKTGKSNYYKSDEKNKNSIADDRIGPVYLDKSKTLWAGTRGGLSKFNKYTGSFTNYQYDSEDSTTINNNNVTSVCEDSDGFLWVGTRKGLNKMNKNTGEFFRQTQFDDILVGSIRVIYEDHLKNLWVGTTSGFFQLNSERTDLYSFHHTANDTNTISNNYISAIYEDDSNRLWVGTLNGLNLYNREAEIFTQYHESDGLPNGTIYGILADTKNNLWLSTNKGLSKFNMENKTFRNYTMRDGLQSDQFHRACYKNTSGKMYFSGSNGFNAFYPDSIHDIKYEPPVRIVDFKLFNKSIAVGDTLNSRIFLKKNIINTDTITLSYKENVFSFEFAALDYSAPEDIKYAYKMEGFEAEWNYTSSNRRFASYTNLPHGEYIFRVKSTNSDGLWLGKETAIHVMITPPFWKTWWFRIIAFLVIGGSLYFWYKTKINKTEKEALANKNEAIVNKKQAQKLARMLKVIAETSNKLDALSGTIRDTSNTLSESSLEHAASLEELAATVEELTQSINSNAEYTSNTANSIKNTSKLSVESGEVITSTLESVEEVNSKITIIQEIANKTSLLSINAAIEAARAGEKGKGFSVVAHEVKKLAEKSAYSSKEIMGLINETIKVSNKASSNYTEMAQDILKMDSSIQHISSSNIEQKISVEQINSALTQINDNSQSNANLASDLNESISEIKRNIDKLEAQIKR